MGWKSNATRFILKVLFPFAHFWIWLLWLPARYGNEEDKDKMRRYMKVLNTEHSIIFQYKKYFFSVEITYLLIPLGKNERRRAAAEEKISYLIWNSLISAYKWQHKYFDIFFFLFLFHITASFSNIDFPLANTFTSKKKQKMNEKKNYENLFKIFRLFFTWSVRKIYNFAIILFFFFFFWFVHCFVQFRFEISFYANWGMMIKKK